MMEIHRGATANPLDWDKSFVPETVCITPEGLLVGALRCRPFACSADLGENWYEIEGLPESRYQPMMICLPDGRFLNAGHKGTDNHFGAVDMFVSMFSFRLEARLPQPTSLTLDRIKRPDGDRYINAYDARLTSADKPLPGREIELRVMNHWTPEGRINPLDVRESPDVRTAQTDENGVARFVLSDMETRVGIHHTYRIASSFTPKPGDDCAPCLGPRRREYSLASTRNCPTSYPVYIRAGWIVVTPETAERFGELSDLVDGLGKSNPEVSFEKCVEILGSAQRAREIVDFLVENRILSLDEDGTYRWYCDVVRDGKVIQGVDVSDIEEYYV